MESASEPHSLGNGPVATKGAFVTCTGLTYKIRVTRRQGRVKTILRDVDIYLAPGEMTVIMGPSGCGKTVLLNILAGRKPRGIVEPGSEILYDGHHPTLHYKRCHIGYVEQKDTLLEMMSPYELLTYTAFLKLPRVTRKEDIKARVQALIDELKLNSCQHTIIGSKESQKISGGEAKRTSIGIAMIANPSVLYIDELTSGLDAYTGHEVATVVKSLCQSGITICSSLHSPSPRTFHLCDRLILLHQGRVLYLGPNGVESLSYLQQNSPFLRKIEADEGIAEYLLDVTANCSEEEASLLAESYRNSNLYEINRYIIKSRNLHDYSKNCTTNGTFKSTVGHLLQIENGADIENNSNVGTISKGSQGNGADFAGNPTWWVVWVMWRFRSLRLWSTISFIAPRVLDKSIFVILITTLWWKVANYAEDVSNVQRVQSLFFTTSCFFLWSTMSALVAVPLLPVIAMERAATYREMYDGLYSPGAYVIYKLVEEFIPQLVSGFVYCLLFYYTIGLNGSFAVFWLVYVATTGVSMGCTLAVAAATPDPPVAGSIILPYMASWSFFNGYLIPFKSIPAYWQWYSIIDPLRYSFGAMMTNQFSSEEPEILPGINLLQFYDLENVNAWAWLGFEALFIPVFIFLFWAAMRWIRF